MGRMGLVLSFYTRLKILLGLDTKAWGVFINVIEWFRSYLVDRAYRVEVEPQRSHLQSQGTYGVLQY